MLAGNIVNAASGDPFSVNAVNPSSAGTVSSPIIAATSSLEVGDFSFNALSATRMQMVDSNNGAFFDIIWLPSTSRYQIAVGGDMSDSEGSGNEYDIGRDTNNNVYPFRNLYIGTSALIGAPVGSTATPAQALQVMNSGAAAVYGQFTNSATGLLAADGLLVGVNASGDAVISQQSSTLPLQVSTNGAVGITVDSAQSVIAGSAAIAPTSTSGFVYIPAASGAPTGVPSAHIGFVATYYDTSNHKFWIYDTATSTWRGVALT
jgi:hypothetical protein